MRADSTMSKEIDFSKGKRGAVLDPTGKTRITIMLDDDILQFFRARADELGIGYQTQINQVLKEYLRSSLEPDQLPLTVGKLREVLRQELGKR